MMKHSTVLEGLYCQILAHSSHCLDELDLCHAENTLIGELVHLRHHRYVIIYHAVAFNCASWSEKSCKLAHFFEFLEAHERFITRSYLQFGIPSIDFFEHWPVEFYQSIVVFSEVGATTPLFSFKLVVHRLQMVG